MMNGGTMAGRRKTRAAEAGVAPPPLSREYREARRLQAAQERLNAATTPRARIGAACDYARSVCGALPPVEQDALAGEVVRVVMTRARDAFGERPGNRGRSS